MATAKLVAKLGSGLVAGLGLGAVGGFVGSMLRRRPATPYAESLRQPVPSEDSTVDSQPANVGS